jgi:P-type Ca2+ transporter type 2C
VVPDDLLVLAEGDVVPADAALVEAAALLVDESALTGESVPVDKTVSAGRDDTADDADRVSAGTVVVRGRARAVVTATGAESAMGRIAALLSTGPGMTPLQRRLFELGRVLAAAAVVLCTLVLGLGLLRGQPLELMAVTAISLAVAAVPESLPAVVTLSLALGARRMAARNAIVRRLPAVETLGSVTVIATDKTGTLTEGRMVAQRLWTPTGEAELTGTGYAPAGSVIRDGQAVTGADVPEVADLLRAAVLCTDATLRPPDPEQPDWTAIGDPTEAALLAAGGKLGFDRAALEVQTPRLAEVPFDSDRKRMTTVHRTEGGHLVVCKGAPEVLFDRAVVADDPAIVRAAAARAEDRAAAGYRVRAVAAAEHPGPPPEPQRLESGLRLLGLVGIADPPRSSAADTLAACHQAGITPVLITGDHPATARAVAAQVGLSHDDAGVVDGRAPGTADLGSARVYARTTPEQKVTIVQAHRDAGDVVAMTGDGVNDGPALRRADIGVAMGRRGTEVARQAADLVLADDELATLVHAVEEGRRVYANVRRFLLYGLSGGAAEIMVMLAGPFLGMPLPLLPAQILWINLMTHGLPGVALGAEPAEADTMRRPPRPPAESVLGAGLWQRIVRLAILITAVTLGVATWAHATGREWQTMTFLTLGLTQLGVALASRSRAGGWANPFLLIAVGAAGLLQLAAVYAPPLQGLLGTHALGPLELAVAAAGSVFGFAGIHLDRRLHPRRARSGDLHGDARDLRP